MGVEGVADAVDVVDAVDVEGVPASHVDLTSLPERRNYDNRRGDALFVA